ncbi:MAG: putative membrane protein [Flavobacteriales bacterium]|jgi:uncharacterized membrane protein
MISNDAVIMGLLAAILGAVFYTNGHSSRFWRGFYRVFPAVLLCYFLPSLLTTFNIIDIEQSKLYFVASRYLLPAALVLLCINIDIPAIISLGPKALILFFVGTLGIVIGGPIALLIVSFVAPELIGVHNSDDLWRAMTTVAGSWIGGSANQTAMKEIFEVKESLFSAMVAVDVLVANVWLAVLLVLAGNAKNIDAKRGVDTRALDNLQIKVSELSRQHSRVSTLQDFIYIIALAFLATGIAHFCADFLAPWFSENYPGSARYSFTSLFFWLILVATTLGIALSFTPLKKLEGAGASKIATVCIYILIATIGTHMNIKALSESPIFFVIGGIWISIHAVLMLLTCKLIKAPLFYMAVGSQANVGGAATAPVVAAAFHPSLAPVGVLLAVLGYAVGTYAAWMCAQLLQLAA